MAAEKTVRKQYLIPERLDRKVRVMSQREKVSATEIVRRALDAYTRSRTTGRFIRQSIPRGKATVSVAEDELADRLLTDALQTLKAVTETVGKLNQKLEAIDERIESGAIRREAEAEMRQWLAANPGAIDAFRKVLASEGDGRRAEHR